MHPSQTTVLARLTASTPRRLLAVVVLSSLAAMLIWVSAVTPAAPGWRIVLFATGIAMIWATLSLWRATAVGLLLTEDGLIQTDGRMIATLDQIVRVDRGVFAWKPSNGFVVSLSERHPLAWAPGLWWRHGRRLGVGGVTGASDARAMADILAMRLSELP